MPSTEVCLIHPGALSASSWARLASHLPAGTPVKVVELETITRYWSADPDLTVEALADRLHARFAVPRERVLVGWGVGGVVADALATPSRRVVVLDGCAAGALPSEPGEAELLRSFAMYLGARRGVRLPVERERMGAGLEYIRAVATAVGALRADTTVAAVRRAYDAHVGRMLRDHRLVAGYEPSGEPVTVVKAARSIAPRSRALGWDRYGPVELLASGGDHYSMLTEPAPAAHLALLLRRWLRPPLAA
jgi:thioesterase domain-containing protein